MRLTAASMRRALMSMTAVAVALEHRHVAVVEVDDLARVREDRRDVARDEVLAVADADEQRTALARRDDLARLVGSR